MRKLWVYLFFLTFVFVASWKILPDIKRMPLEDKNYVGGKFLEKEAMFYREERIKDKLYLRCQLCFRSCLIGEGKRGICRARENRGGKLYTITYGYPTAIQVDPVEKEPQYHMLPGSKILCLGGAGCNIRCKFCHNWHISQFALEEVDYFYKLTPEECVKLAEKEKIPTISFTYNEPIAFYEYMLDIAKLAKKSGLRVIFHTNGTLAPEPLELLLNYVDAVTVDLKGFREEFYSGVSLAPKALEAVKNNLKLIKRNNKHLEIVCLIIPTLNDDLSIIEEMCNWIYKNLGKDVPIHFSRYFPAYKLNLPSTSIKTLEEAYNIARKVGLEFVYIGNVPGHKYNSTFCPKCGKCLIKRIHFSVIYSHMNQENSRCKSCGYHIPGIWG
jgi:pyruvate formate lyase activating enzyme